MIAPVAMDGLQTYSRLARFYDLYVGDFDADIGLYEALCDPSQRVLEIGCGTGRILSPLLRNGCVVTGVDISEEMLSLARAKLQTYIDRGTLTLVKQDFLRTTMSRQFDRILITYYTFNYLTDRKDQQTFLRNAVDCLADGGVLVMDLFFPRALDPRKQSNRWRQSFLGSAGAQITLNEKKKMVGQIEQRLQWFDDGAVAQKVETNRRFVTKQQAEHLLRQVGFGGIKVADGYAFDQLHPVTEKEPTLTSFVCVAGDLSPRPARQWVD